MRCDVSQAITPGWVRRRLELASEQVNLRVGKVREAAGVVEVEVRGNDVAHITGLEAERLDLRERGLGRIETGADECSDGSAKLARPIYVVNAEAGVDEDQPLGALDQQAVADKPCAGQQATLAG
jgi:hypothetical protein